MPDEQKRSFKRPWRAEQRRGGKFKRSGHAIGARAPMSVADAVATGGPDAQRKLTEATAAVDRLLRS
jgi:hypothetical protein